MKHFLFLWLLVFGLVCSAPVNAEFFTNNTLDLETMSAQEAVNLFTLFTSYTAKGERVNIILPPKNGTSFRVLAVRYMNRSPMEYYDMVQARIYTGKARAVFADSDDHVVIKVAATPNSLGFHHEKLYINTGLGLRVVPLTGN